MLVARDCWSDLRDRNNKKDRSELLVKLVTGKEERAREEILTLLLERKRVESI